MNKYAINQHILSHNRVDDFTQVVTRINMSYFIYLIYIQKKYSKLETHAYNTFCLIHADVKVFEGMYVVHWYGIAQYKKCDTLVSQKVPITLQDKVPCHCIKNV